MNIINNKKDDFSITMLRFGKDKMHSGFKLQELVEYMKQHGFEREFSSISSTLLKEYASST